MIASESGERVSTGEFVEGMEILSTLHDQNRMIDKVVNAGFRSNPQSPSLEIASETAANQRIVFFIDFVSKLIRLKACTPCAK